jgi:sialic acid synthase SpsE
MGKERKVFIDQLPSILGYKPVETIRIGKRKVGKGQPTLIIAEVGANHRGDIKNALKAIDEAAKAGADVVKFQHITADRLAADTIVDAEHAGKKVGKFSDFYRSAEMPVEWTDKLIAHCKKRGVMFMSTPFDEDMVEVLDKAGVAAFKVASYELIDDHLLALIASKKKPIILSTGMTYLEEVAHAVRIIQEAGNNQIVLLHCISIYPPKSYADLNLRAITTLQGAFKLPVGYSDHSKPPSVAAPLGAVALGACVIEKHFTSDRSGGSNDDPNSMMQEEFARTVAEVRQLELAMSGSGIKQPVAYPENEGDEVADRWARPSVYAKRNLEAGQVVTWNDVETLRPWGGLSPADFEKLVGKKLTKSVDARQPVTLDHFLS